MTFSSWWLQVAPTVSTAELSSVEKKAAESLYSHRFESRINLRKASVLQLLKMDPNSYYITILVEYLGIK